MPYADPEKRRAAQRRYVQAKRARARAAKRAQLPAAPQLPDGLAAWCADLVVTQGAGAGDPLELWPWELAVLDRLEALADGELGLSVGAGAGKTTLAAAVCAAAVAGPLAQPRGAVIGVAGSFAQALILADHVQAFLRPVTDADPDRWRVLRSESAALVEDRETGAVFRAREASARTLHGSAPSLVVADEPAQWQPTQAAALYSAIRSRLGKLEGSRLFAIGTRSADAQHWFSRLLIRSGVAYHADPAADPFDPATWETANPSLVHLPALRRVYQREAVEAAADPSLLPAFKALRLNLGAVDHEVALLLAPESWERCECDLLPAAAGPSVLAFDLSGGDAMAAAACYWPSTGRLEALAAFPALPALAERSRIDGADYATMQAEGDLLILGDADERVVRVELLLREALRRWGRPSRIIADYHQLKELRTALDRARFPAAALVTTGMGWSDSPGRIRDFRRSVGGGSVWAHRRLLLRQALANARTVSDSMGSEKVVKGGAPGRKRTARDDVAVAALLAVSEGWPLRDRPRRPTLRYAIA